MDLRVISDEGPFLQLSVAGVLSMATLSRESEALAELLQEHGGFQRTVLLEVSGVELVDSAGMSWFVVQHKRFCDAGGNLAIYSVPYNVMETLKVMRLDRVLNIAEDESAALALVQGAAGR